MKRLCDKCKKNMELIQTRLTNSYPQMNIRNFKCKKCKFKETVVFKDDYFMPTKKPDWEERFDKKFKKITWRVDKVSTDMSGIVCTLQGSEGIKKFIKQVEQEAEERVKELIEACDEYIELLESKLEGNAILEWAHGRQDTQGEIELGEKLRKKIAELKREADKL